MKNERKEFGEPQTSFPKNNSQEGINLSEHSEECYSALPKRTPTERETGRPAERLAVNYIRSLLLF